MGFNIGFVATMLAVYVHIGEMNAENFKGNKLQQGTGETLNLFHCVHYDLPLYSFFHC